MKELKSGIAKEFAFFFSMPAILWQVFFLWAPLIIITYFSLVFVSQSNQVIFPSWQNYRSLFDFDYVRIIARSCLLASSTALSSLIIAYPLVYFIVIKARRWKRFFLFFLILPFWTNFLVLAYTWFFLLERNGIINNFLIKIGIISEPLHLAHNLIAVFVVMVYCYLPFMIMPLYTALEKIDIRLLEASSDLGASPWQTFTRITIPLSLPGIKTGILLVFVPAFGEFAIPALIGGAKYMFAGSLISYYFFVARNNGLGAAFTILVGFVLLLIVLIFNMVCRTKQDRRGMREGL